MLYLSTRNKGDAFTAAHAFREDRANDGGLFIPFRLPVFTQEQIRSLGDRSFGQTASELLNLFYGCKLHAWDVDFAIGRNPLKAFSMSHRLLVAEVWHNLDRDITPMLQRLNDLALQSESGAHISDWANVALRITALFGVFGELKRCELTDLHESVDISLPCGSFDWIMAAWYAKAMGLPVGMIICACNDNGAGWDLLHQGQLHTDAQVKQTNTPLADYAVPSGMERLICSVFGVEEARRFAEKVRLERLYTLEEEQSQLLREGMYSAVISSERVGANILSLYRTGNYIASPYTVLAYSALMDYRARSGESRKTLLLGCHSPEHDAETVADALGISAQQLAEKMR